MKAVKKIKDYMPEKKAKVNIPARVQLETIRRAQVAANKMNVPFCDFIEGAINMASDQASKS